MDSAVWAMYFDHREVHVTLPGHAQYPSLSWPIPTEVPSAFERSSSVLSSWEACPVHFWPRGFIGTSVEDSC